MRSLHRVFEELKRGENIDLYVTVVVALIVAILNLFGIAPQNWLSSLNLAVLALLASAILGNRQRLEDIQENLTQTAESDISLDFPSELDSDLDRASEVWLMGVHVSSTLGHKYAVLESKLQEGATIHALIVDPDGAACAMAAARHPGRLFVERERALITASLNGLCDLKMIAPDKLEIRIIDNPLPYGGFMLNPGKSDGAIYLKRYSFQTGLRPISVYRPKNRRWFDFIKSEINALWNHGTEWPCEKQAEPS